MSHNAHNIDDDAIEAPDYLWDRAGPPDEQVIELEQALAGFRSRRGRQRTPASARRWLPLAAAIALAAVAGWLALRPDRTTAAWDVHMIAGTATIDSRPIGAATRFRVGQALETPAGSRVRVRVADIGDVTVHPESRLRLLASRADREHRIQLDRGKIEALIFAPPRLFFVNTPSAVAVDLGCAYDLEVDDEGNGLLQVTFGWVSFERDGRESIVPSGAACRTSPDIGPGTPYFANASERFKMALDQFDFSNGGAAALDVILAEAHPNDTLTLWHLLSRVGANQVSRVFNRLTELAPPPADVDHQDVLRLDHRALKSWFDELERLW